MEISHQSVEPYPHISEDDCETSSSEISDFTEHDSLVKRQTEQLTTQLTEQRTKQLSKQQTKLQKKGRFNREPREQSSDVQQLLSLSTDGSQFNIQMHQRKLDQVRINNIRAIERRVASCNHNLKSLSSEHQRLINEYNRSKSPASKLKRSTSSMNDSERYKTITAKLERDLEAKNKDYHKIEAELTLLKKKQEEENSSSICVVQ